MPALQSSTTSSTSRCESDAIIYTISIHDEYDSDAKPDVLKKLSRATGGESFFPRNPEHTTQILERIAHDIRSGYTLGYSPSHDAPGYRAIRVEVHGPDGRSLNVQARIGLYRRRVSRT